MKFVPVALGRKGALHAPQVVQGQGAEGRAGAGPRQVVAGHCVREGVPRPLLGWRSSSGARMRGVAGNASSLMVRVLGTGEAGLMCMPMDRGMRQRGVLA